MAHSDHDAAAPDDASGVIRARVEYEANGLRVVELQTDERYKRARDLGDAPLESAPVRSR